MPSTIVHGLAGLVKLLPTVIVTAILVSLFYWGHTTNWTAPKLSVLLGEESGAPDADDKPPAAALAKDEPPAKLSWCEKHQVPDDQCVICHPELAARTALAAQLRPVSVVYDPSAVATHDPRSCKLLTARIRFASLEALEKTGLRVEAVREQPLAITITASGMLDFDPNHVAKLGPRANGMVYRICKDLGDPVKAGEVVALVDAAEVGKAKAEYLQALSLAETKTWARSVLRPESVADRTLKDAEAAEREARLQLYTAQQALINLGLPLRPEEFAALPVDRLTRQIQYLGVPQELIAGLPTDTLTANLLPVIAPFGGEVVAREVVAGEAVAARQVLLTVADPTHLHAHLDVAPNAAAGVRLGQRVEFRTDGDLRAIADGRLTWISPAVDEKTRLLHLHAEFSNRDRHLRAKAYGTATITVRTLPKAVVVPEDAVQWEGCSHIVFVRLGEKEYATRRVVLGQRQDGVVEVITGVVAGEVVATTGSHALKSELLKDRLGGGDD